MPRKSMDAISIDISATRGEALVEALSVELDGAPFDSNADEAYWIVKKGLGGLETGPGSFRKSFGTGLMKDAGDASSIVLYLTSQETFGMDESAEYYHELWVVRSGGNDDAKVAQGKLRITRGLKDSA